MNRKKQVSHLCISIPIPVSWLRMQHHQLMKVAAQDFPTVRDTVSQKKTKTKTFSYWHCFRRVFLSAAMRHITMRICYTFRFFSTTFVMRGRNALNKTWNENLFLKLTVRNCYTMEWNQLIFIFLNWSVVDWIWLVCDLPSLSLPSVLQNQRVASGYCGSPSQSWSV